MVRKKGATDLVMQNSHFSVLLELSWMRKMHDFPIRKHTNIHMYVYMCVCVCVFVFPSQEDLPNLGIEPRSPALQADSLPSELPG